MKTSWKQMNHYDLLEEDFTTFEESISSRERRRGNDAKTRAKKIRALIMQLKKLAREEVASGHGDSMDALRDLLDGSL